MKLAAAILLLVGLTACSQLNSHKSPASAATFNVRAFGANPDGKMSCTRQIQQAIDACAKAGGGTVLVPAGQYVTGTLWLRSNINLHLDAGATLLGSQDMNEFPEWRSKWEGDKAAIRRAAMICGEELENVSLTGRGTIDARGEMWWKLQRAKKGVEVLRPLLFRVVNSHHVLVDGLTFRNSPMWTISPLACDDVTITGITIQNPPDSPNTDGINPESCRNVRISNCQVDVGDDCITIKSGKETDNRRELWPSENITITNCTLLHGHGGVVIGSEMSGSVRNVVISNCVMVKTDRGLRFKGRRGRGGVVEDIRADNIIMDGVLCPIAINLFYAPNVGSDPKTLAKTPMPVNDSTPRFRRLRFSNITAKGVNQAAAFMCGLPEMHVDDVVLDNVAFYLDPQNTTRGKPEMAPDMVSVTRGGLIARWIDRLSLRNVTISEQLGAAISITGGSTLTLADLDCRTPPQANALIDLTDIGGASLRNVSIPIGTPTALRVTGAATTGIRVIDTDLSHAKQPVEIDPSVKADAVRVPSTNR